jgi:hypothetical protein
MSRTKKQQTQSIKQIQVLRLKVALCGTEPFIWRRLDVRSDMNLDLLHAAIQVAMGWTNSHLHAFFAGRERFVDPTINGEPEFLDEPPEVDERKVKVKDVLPRADAQIIYEYDFGDSWYHTVTVEEILYAQANSIPSARCLDGARACPPEDCGGVGGYADLLRVLEDSSHEEYKSMMTWLGRRWDPDAFDLQAINNCLLRLRWPRTTVAQLARLLIVRDAWRETQVP